MEKLILLIDDDNEEFLILKQAVEMAGLAHHCIWANGMDHALHVLGQVLPDYILIDYNMPKNNGMVCLDMIRKMDNLHDTPVTMYSNFISNIVRERALLKGAGCMEKPATITQLASCLIAMTAEGNRVRQIQA